MSDEKIFQAITNFVKDLGDAFASDIHSLALYERLIMKTTMVHKEAVEKHISAFRAFYNSNKENIIAGKPEFSAHITYSQKVFINLNDVFKLEMDEDTCKAIWNHIRVISILLDPSVKDSLPATKSVQLVPVLEGDTDEDRFLNKVITKVQSHVSDETTDPQAAISAILSSDLIPELVGSINSGMSNGTFNIGNMLLSVEKMVGSIGGGDQQTSDAMSMLRGLMGNMKM